MKHRGYARPLPYGEVSGDSLSSLVFSLPLYECIMYNVCNYYDRLCYSVLDLLCFFIATSKRGERMKDAAKSLRERKRERDQSVT